MADTSDKTIVSMFSQRVAADGEQAAIHVKRGGRFHAHTWNDLQADVRRAAAFLVSLGVKPGDRVVQWSENRYEWIVTDLAIQLAQAVHVPIHAALSGSQASFQIEHSGAIAAVLSGKEQVQKLAAGEEHLAGNVSFLSHDLPNGRLCGRPIQGWPPLAGEDAEREGAGLQHQALKQLTPESIATILYTSGTTGDPLGVTLTHGNLASNALSTLTTMGERPSDVRVNFLPFSHIFARTCELYTWIGVGAQLALAESRDGVIEDCQTIRPTLLNGVPYFYERVHQRLVDDGTADEPGSIRRLLGGRIRNCCCGGSALSDHTFDFFERQDVPILQGYGLTELSPVLTVSTLTHYRRGTVGRPLPDVELQIAADSEILARGPNVMVGYWNDENRTSQALREGWLHTGDLGELDEDGFLQITGRKKELIVTATGMNIAPTSVESLLCRDPLIEQAMVIGDNLNSLCALIVPHAAHLETEIRSQSLTVSIDQRPLTDPRVLELYERRIREQLAGLSQHEQIRRFTLLDRRFTIEAGHLTPKASLRRDAIQRDFAPEIEQMDYPSK